ncbi:MAG TPA: GAF domain-containing protein [Kofleriaceae bacterium]|nr:GAF domain-containing protein [Kofleriaceae bacterium]
MTSFDAIRERCAEIMLITPEERMYADILDLLLGVFESEFGYFGYINTSGDLVCPSMTRNIYPACQVPDKDIVFPRTIWGGLWGRILFEQRSLIKNDPHQVPNGHLPIGRSFGSPILYRGTLIGQFHFANRASDYTEDDVELLESTCEFIAPVLNARLRHDEELRRRAQLQAELEATNEQLRTKLAELERLNAALLDREDRMIELKAELARLKGPGTGG